jgi:DNA-binding NtrC family response regulator
MAGFHVMIAETKEDAAATLQNRDLDVAVFSYTLPTATVEELAELLREYCPDTPLITIANQRWADRRISPTEIVLAEEGPRALIAAIRRATRAR